MRCYRFVDHTADFGLQIFGSDAGDLFSNAAIALFDIIADPEGIQAEEQSTIRVSGVDWPDLMVNWLRELLFQWNAKQRLVKTVRISKISEKKLVAHLRCDRFAPNRHVIKTEIKAVTYHQIRVIQKAGQWEARVIFDV